MQQPVIDETKLPETMRMIEEAATLMEEMDWWLKYFMDAKRI